jgi:hypothetical protein
MQSLTRQLFQLAISKPASETLNADIICIMSPEYFPTMNPVVVTLHGDAGDSDVLQGLQGFDGAGKGAGQDLAGVEQVTADQDEIDLFGDGVGNNAAEHTEKVFVALGFTGRGAVCFAEMDVGGVEEFYFHRPAFSQFCMYSPKISLTFIFHFSGIPSQVSPHFWDSKNAMYGFSLDGGG